MKYENFSDSEIVSLFECRYDYGGEIDKELLDKYLSIVERNVNNE